MSNHTQAVVISAPGQVGLRDVALKQPTADDVVIETAFTSISAGTERMLLAGQMPHPMLQLPVVPGYETVGRVVEVGSNVDKALLERLVYVGGAHCYDDVNPAWGGQSARLFTGAERVVTVDNIQPEHGVMLALSATALHGIDLLKIKPDNRLLILGQGPVGQLAARFASHIGAHVTVTDKNSKRLAHSVAANVINVAETPLTEALTDPVDIIIDATGSMDAITEALPKLNLGGTILLLGYYNKLDLPYMPLFLKEAKLLTAKEWAAGDLERSRDMIAAGTLDVAPLITHFRPIQEVAAAYDTALNDTDCLKLVLDWTQETL